jgi:hypothetical protein
VFVSFLHCFLKYYLLCFRFGFNNRAFQGCVIKLTQTCYIEGNLFCFDSSHQTWVYGRYHLGRGLGLKIKKKSCPVGVWVTFDPFPKKKRELLLYLCVNCWGIGFKITKKAVLHLSRAVFNQNGTTLPTNFQWLLSYASAKTLTAVVGDVCHLTISKF